MSNRIQPDVVVIGHVSRDVTHTGHVLGGGAAYASLTIKALGLLPAVVTSCGPDVDLSSVLPEIPVHVKPAGATTTFVNTYDGGRRRQQVKAVAETLCASDVPSEWRAAPFVLLTPLVREIDDSVLDAFGSPTVVASFQGWIREWDDDGVVSTRHWDGGRVLDNICAAQFSDDDGVTPEQIERWTGRCPVLLHTKGASGSRVWVDGSWYDQPAFPAHEVDPTGGGDVFSAAFLVKFRESGDALDAARFASCAASFCVERVGAEGIPNRAMIEARLSGE